MKINRNQYIISLIKMLKRKLGSLHLFFEGIFQLI